MKNALISVIVPIYNVEKYTNKCVDSLINQTYKNLEIILVDDGSLDNCGNICDSYKKKDSRIKVLHKKNGGLSDARNKGFKISTGEYVTFIDSDDFVSNDYVDYLYNLLKKYNADISIILPQKFNDSKEFVIKNKKEKIKIYNPYDAIETMLYQKEFDNAAWGKLYSRKIMEGILFPVGKLYEDISTTYKYFLNSSKIVYSNQKKYYYLQRHDSIMGSKFKVKEMDYIYQTKDMLDNLSNLNDKKLLLAAQSRFVSANFSILLKINKNKYFSKEMLEARNNIKEYQKYLIFNSKVRIKNKIALFLFNIGVI